jgi:hypothetical protein
MRLARLLPVLRRARAVDFADVARSVEAALAAADHQPEVTMAAGASPHGGEPLELSDHRVELRD